MSVREYSLKFSQLSRYAPEMVVDMRSTICLFVVGLSRQSSKKGKAKMSIGDMDIESPMIHAQRVEEDKLKDRKRFKIKRVKTSSSEFRQQRVVQSDLYFNINRRDFLHYLLVPCIQKQR